MLHSAFQSLPHYFLEFYSFFILRKLTVFLPKLSFNASLQYHHFQERRKRKDVTFCRKNNFFCHFFSWTLS